MEGQFHAILIEITKGGWGRVRGGIRLGNDMYYILFWRSDNTRSTFRGSESPTEKKLDLI